MAGLHPVDRTVMRYAIELAAVRIASPTHDAPADLPDCVGVVHLCSLLRSVSVTRVRLKFPLARVQC